MKGFEAKYSYGKHVEYEIPPSYIREIIDAHLHCRQFIKVNSTKNHILVSIKIKINYFD